MKQLEEKILKDGIVLDGDVLKVGSFLNQQIDVELLRVMGEEIDRIYKGSGATKILTVEASGIALASAAGLKMNLPVVFAKKSVTSNVTGETYCAKVHSYTHNKDNTIIVPKNYICKNDKILIIDDFLAMGQAFEGLINICEQAGADIVGCTAAIEKGYQGGGDALRKRGIRVESLAVIDSMSENGIVFRK